MAALRTLPLGAGHGEEPGLDIYIIYLRIYVSNYLRIYVSTYLRIYTGVEPGRAALHPHLR